jgi:hypothetical protein
MDCSGRLTKQGFTQPGHDVAVEIIINDDFIANGLKIAQEFEPARPILCIAGIEPIGRNAVSGLLVLQKLGLGVKMAVGVVFDENTVSSCWRKMVRSKAGELFTKVVGSGYTLHINTSMPVFKIINDLGCTVKITTYINDWNLSSGMPVVGTASEINRLFNQVKTAGGKRIISHSSHSLLLPSMLSSFFNTKSLFDLTDFFLFISHCFFR